MLSYEERLESFSIWPDDMRTALSKKLAIIGQYAIQGEQSLTTVCIFCKKKLNDWRAEDEPLVEHMKHNNKCPLFELRNKVARKAIMMKHCREETAGADMDFLEKEDIFMRNRMIRMDLRRDRPFVFCLVCGVTQLNHFCKVRRVVSNITEKTMDLGLFYIRWLKGEYLGLVDSYVKYDLCIPEAAKEGVRRILGTMLKEGAQIRLEDALNLKVEILVNRLEREIMKAEAKALAELEEN